MYKSKTIDGIKLGQQLHVQNHQCHHTRKQYAVGKNLTCIPLEEGDSDNCHWLSYRTDTTEWRAHTLFDSQYLRNSDSYTCLMVSVVPASDIVSPKDHTVSPAVPGHAEGESESSCIAGHAVCLLCLLMLSVCCVC